jgi:nucleotidyltransferase substrate binding protein (TIGR01987 family)
MSDSERFKTSLQNFSSALSQLTTYLSTPVIDDRDRAGVIQAFEFCYELAWKTLKKLAETKGLEAPTPIDAFQAGFQMQLITEAEHSVWLEMKQSRNLTSHTYKQELALTVFDEIQSKYHKALTELEQRFQKHNT